MSIDSPHSQGFGKSASDGHPGTVALLADIGGTRARFAYLSGGQVGSIANFAVAEFSGFVEALADFIGRQPADVRAKYALLAVAGPIHDKSVSLTNSGWHINADELCRAFGFQQVELINDHAALALAVPHFRPQDLLQIGDGQRRPDAPAAVIGPGTGLGVAALMPGEPPRAIQTEGGHVTLPGTERREDAVIAFLRERMQHVSAERVLSGPGLVNLYHAISAVDGLTGPVRTAKEISDAAIARSCPLAEATLAMFANILGSFAGNVALTFGAQGGVYIAGGIAASLARYLSASNFRARFEAKGRFRPYLSNIPTHIITRENPAFLGLKHYGETGLMSDPRKFT